MASVWPRLTGGGFEREGDKEYMAPEVLQGKYSKAADIFGLALFSLPSYWITDYFDTVFRLGVTILETATNIVVPGQ